jgi:signal transduction histidine kinase
MRLKTKLLLGILGTIFIVVVSLSVLYIGQLLRQRIRLSYSNHNVIAHEVLYNVRHTLETGLKDKQFNANDPAALRELVATTLREDEDLQSILASVIRYSPAVYDATVVDTADRELIGTDPSARDQLLPPRPDFSRLADASTYQQVRAVFGRPQVFDVSVPLERNGKPLAIVRVGIRTTFLLAEMRPTLRNAILFSTMLAALSVLIAALLSNLALRPIALISTRLDQLTQYQLEAPSESQLPGPSDEVSIVSTKIERLGQRMRNVQEVFSALKENLDQILGNLQDGLVLFTRDGRAVLVSVAAARFLEVDRDRILGSAIQDFLDRSTVLGRAIRDAFDGRIALLQEEVITETKRRVQISLDFIHDDETPSGNALGALLTLHDAESAEQLEDELEMSRRLAAIGRLTAGVGHEVKNPINAIVVHVELLRNKLAQSPPETQRHIEVIHGEVQRLNRVVQNLVDFSRPVEPHLLDHDLRQITQAVLDLESVEFPARAIVLDSKMSDMPLTVHVDADMIKQALLNIVQNAVQAMPGGGTLTVRVERSSRNAVVTIRDQGAGIAPDQLDKIFNLYFTTKPSGSGIGLAMTYRILQLHNGKIDVQSTEGVGTTFTLNFPLSAIEARPRPVTLEGLTPSPVEDF